MIYMIFLLDVAHKVKLGQKSYSGCEWSPRGNWQFFFCK